MRWTSRAGDDRTGSGKEGTAHAGGGRESRRTASYRSMERMRTRPGTYRGASTESLLSRWIRPPPRTDLRRSGPSCGTVGVHVHSTRLRSPDAERSANHTVRHTGLGDRILGCVNGTYPDPYRAVKESMALVLGRAMRPPDRLRSASGGACNKPRPVAFSRSCADVRRAARALCPGDARGPGRGSPARDWCPAPD